MNNICRYFDKLLFVVCFLGYVGEFISPSIYTVSILGLIGLVYCLYCLWVMLFHKIRRDWTITKGHFLIKVINFVLLMPFVLTMMFHLANHSNNGEIASYSPRNIVNEDGLYQSKEYPLYIEDQEDVSLFWTVYYHFIDPGNQHMTTSKSGRQRAAMAAILGYLLLNGLLVSTLISWFDRRKEKWLKGEVRYNKFFSRRWHYVVIGGNEMVPGLLKQIFEKDENILPYIIVQTSSDVEALRREIFSELEVAQQRRVIIYYGNRNSEIDLKDLCVAKATEVYVLGEDTRTDDIESYHDTINMKCLSILYELYKETPEGQKITELLPEVGRIRLELADAFNSKVDKYKKEGEIRHDPVNIVIENEWANRRRLVCRVMFEYQTTFSVFQFFDLDDNMADYVDFVPFNFYEMSAQNVLINRELDSVKVKTDFVKGGYLPLEGACGIGKNDESFVHLYIVGMSRMGVAMAIEAAHLAHFPNFETRGKRTKITFIDKNAQQDKDFFMGRFKDLFAVSKWTADGLVHNPQNVEHLGGDFLDVEWEFITGGIEQPEVQKHILEATKSGAKITIAICHSQSNAAHAAALYLDKKIYDSDAVLQVLVYNKYGNSIMEALRSENPACPYYNKLRAFGTSSDALIIKYLEQSEVVGQYIDDAYNENIPQFAINPIGNFKGKSKVSCRWSSIYNGNTLWTKLRCVKFDPSVGTLSNDDIEILADLEHNRWNMEQLLMNFRTLSPEEQAEIKNGTGRTKNQFKSQMAHLDICSNKKLMEIDKDVRKYDVDLVACLPEIYQKLL